jgi:hypothetical protein
MEGVLHSLWVSVLGGVSHAILGNGLRASCRLKYRVVPLYRLVVVVLVIRCLRVLSVTRKTSCLTHSIENI